MNRLHMAVVCLVLFTAANARAAAPTVKDVAYGDDRRQVLDFYRAESKEPTPLLFFIHGGGWMNGDKGTFNNTDVYLQAGISVVSIEYRFVTQAAAAEVKPPVKWPLEDAARALQFVRSKHQEWNLDPSRIAGAGSSAGACSALWLAFHDDLADQASADPVARQSTRLACVAVARAQTSLDPKQMEEWIPNNRYGAHAFGFESYGELAAARDKILPWIREYSPYELATRDDPPVGLYYNSPPAMGKEQDNPAHSANFGEGLQERLKQLGVECEFVYPGAKDLRYPQLHQFVIAKLKGEKK